MGRNDKIVRLKSNPHARKRWPALPNELEVRLINRTIKGKDYAVLTSMTDPMRYPSADIADLYTHRWEK
ncbi:MAG: IS4 transposase [Shewanella sp.]